MCFDQTKCVIISSSSHIQELEFVFSQESGQINIKSGWWDLQMLNFLVLGLQQEKQRKVATKIYEYC